MADGDSFEAFCQELGLNLANPRQLVKRSIIKKLPDPPELPIHLEKKLTPISRYLRSPGIEFHAPTWLGNKINLPDKDIFSDQPGKEQSLGSLLTAALKEKCSPVKDRTLKKSYAFQRLNDLKFRLVVCASKDFSRSGQELEVGVSQQFGASQEVSESHEVGVSQGHIVSASETPREQWSGHQTHMDAFARRLNTGKKRSYQCSACGMEKGTRAAVLSHINAQTGLSFKCKRCDYKSNNPDCFVQHKKRCGRKSYPCKECEFVASKQGELTRHLLVHTKEKVGACALCKMKFSLKFNLKRHEKRCRAR